MTDWPMVIISICTIVLVVGIVLYSRYKRTP